MKLLFIDALVLSLPFFVLGGENHYSSDTNEGSAKLRKLQLPKREKVKRDKCLSELPCLEVDECNYSKILTALKPFLKEVGCMHKPQTELNLHGYKKTKVNKLCTASGYTTPTSPLNPSSPLIPSSGPLSSCFYNFNDITNEGPVFDKEYFDGGTYYNEARENNAGDDELADDPGSLINTVFNDHAQSKIISWPGNYIDNFEDCEYNAAMCCFVQDRQAEDNNGNCDTPYDTNCVDADPGDNTDICYVDMERAPTSSRTPEGFALFPRDGDEATEGSAHCHGFAWAENPRDLSAIFKGNNLFYVSMYDHFYQRGYVRNVPGAPMCGCIEKMSVVSRSDCTQIDGRFRFKICFNQADQNWTITCDVDIDFNACQGLNNNNNDLEAHYRKLVQENKIDDNKLDKFLETVVGNDKCPERTSKFLKSKLEQYNLL